MIRRCLACVLIAVAPACGFHLAGARPLPAPLASVYIDLVTPYRVSKPPLEQSLRTRLLRRGAKVTGSVGSAQAVLRLTEMAESRRVLSVDRFGKAVEYELTTRVKFELLHRGAVVVEPDLMQVSRDYSFNAQQVLAKEAEEERLQAYLQDELAELLILRLEARLSARPPEQPPAAAPADAPGATPEP